MSKVKKAPAMLDGNKWRSSHQKQLNSILTGTGISRTLTSKGSQFFNRDEWTQRSFTAAFCEWASLNADSTPTEADVGTFLFQANRSQLREDMKGITIAATPDDLPKGLARALVGGICHEGWHSLYSRRSPITPDEVWPRIQELWDTVPYDPSEGHNGWANLTRNLLDWSNLIEDIRIERCGCQEFPGTPQNMEALQDLILKMEEEGRAISEHRGLRTNDALSVVFGTFRDLGLGYTTLSQERAYQGYQERSMSGYLFVTEGPLRPLLDRALALGPQDDLECLWLAMEVVALIVEKSQQEPQPEPQPEEPSEEASEPSEEASEPQAGQGPTPPPPRLFKKGDRAVLKAGPYAGRTVEVTKASLPHPETGVQNLAYSLVEEEK